MNLKAAMEFLHFVFEISGNPAALFLFLASLITFRRILRRKSIELFSGVPCTMTLLYCLLSLWSGLPFASPHILVTTINLTGAAVIFIVYVAKNALAKMLVVVGLLLTDFNSVVLASVFALHCQGSNFFCGLAEAIFSGCMYVFLLAIRTQVMRTESGEFTMTSLYVVMGDDLFMEIANGVGCTLGALQLILFAVYRKQDSKADGPKTTNDDANKNSLEISLTKPCQVHNRRILFLITPKWIDECLWGTLCMVRVEPVSQQITLTTESRGTRKNLLGEKVAWDTCSKHARIGHFVVLFSGNNKAAAFAIKQATDRVNPNTSLEGLARIFEEGREKTLEYVKTKYDITSLSNSYLLVSTLIQNGKFLETKCWHVRSSETSRPHKVGLIGTPSHADF